MELVQEKLRNLKQNLATQNNKIQQVMIRNLDTAPKNVKSLTQQMLKKLNFQMAKRTSVVTG